MEEFMKGDVVVVPFPFSDLRNSKKRPALVSATLEGDDLILCQITSEIRNDKYNIILEHKDFVKGGLNVTSVIRPNKLFTADKSIIIYKVGSLRNSKIKEIEELLIGIFAS
jgi:mRNA interferase MazF